MSKNEQIKSFVLDTKVLIHFWDSNPSFFIEKVQYGR